MRPSPIAVAQRYLLATAAITPQQALALVQRYERQLLGKMDDPAELKRLYLEMAEQIRPLASALDGVVMQRTDEARKLKNVKSWLAMIRRRTDPTSFDDTRPERWDTAVSAWLIDLTDALKSLTRVKDRLTGYSSVEKVIPHGKYEIINKHGYRPEEYADALALLDDASEKIKQAGFGQAVYGTVILEAHTDRGYAGIYHHESDVIGLNMAARNRINGVYTLVHELGHRVWHKLVSDQQRDRYEDLYYGTAPLSFSLQTRELFWEALEASSWDARSARARLPKELQSAFSEYWADYKKGNVLPNQKNLGVSLEVVRQQFVRPKHRYYVIDHRTLSSVTDYGQTNVKEDFAEVFAHYCSKMRLTPDAAERFFEATGKR